MDGGAPPPARPPSPPASVPDAPPPGVERFPLGPVAELAIEVREKGTGKRLPEATVYIEDVGELLHLDGRGARRAAAAPRGLRGRRARPRARAGRSDRAALWRATAGPDLLHPQGAPEHARDRRARAAASPRDRRRLAAGRGDPQHPGDVRRSVSDRALASGRRLDHLGARLSRDPRGLTRRERHLHRRDQGAAPLSPRLRARGHSPAVPRVARFHARELPRRVRPVHRGR